MRITMQGKIQRKGRSGKDHARNRMMMSSGILTYMLLLLMRAALTGAIGDAGVGLFAPAFELFFLAGIILSQSMSRTMGNLIRYRVKRQQYQNAQKVFTAGFMLNLILGALMAGIMILTADWLSRVACLEEFSRLALIAAAPSILAAAMIGAFRGFLNGFGLGKIVVKSQYLEKALMLVLSFACGRSMQTYGRKVSVLLQKEAYAYLYGALGAMLGIMLAELIILILLLVLTMLYKGSLKRTMLQDAGRRSESAADLYRTLLPGCLGSSLVLLIPNLLLLIDQRFFNYCMNATGQGEVRTTLWGVCYGKSFAVAGLVAAFLCLCAQGHAAKISAAYEKEEYHLMRERMDQGIRSLSMAAFPAAVFLAVLSPAVSEIFFRTETEYTASVLLKSAAVVLFFAFSFLFGQLLTRFRMLKEHTLIVLIALLVHIFLLYLLVRKSLLGIDGVVISMLLFYAAYAVLGFLLLQHTKSCRIDWLHSLIFPAAAACLSGLLVLLISRLLLDSAGGLVTLVVGLVAGFLTDMLLLMVLQVVTENDLARMPFGAFFILIGQNTGILR